MHKLDDIFKDTTTKHKLTLFEEHEKNAVEAALFDRSGKPYLKCHVSDKDRPAKPEEIVRQLWLRRLTDRYHYPKSRIRVEYPVAFGSDVNSKSADIVIFKEDLVTPYIIFEVKKPNRRDGRQQLQSYCNAQASPLGVWSNGSELLILHRTEVTGGGHSFTPVSRIPINGQTIQSVIEERWTIDKLEAEDILVKNRTSLKKIILDLEDLVLANADGVDDSFDEVFKLIYAKLYDEWAAESLPTRNREIEFRQYNRSASDLHTAILQLFKDARNKWAGVFTSADTIKLKPDHLLTCVAFLQDVYNLSHKH